MAKIFVSYSRDDSEFVLKLREDLHQAGVDIWIDQLDIKPGEPWDRAVQQALQDAQVMMVILSPASVASDNVMDEVEFALENNKRIIPIVHRPCDIPYRLRRLQRIDFTGDYSACRSKLLSCLQAPRPAPEPPTGPSLRRKYARLLVLVAVGIVVVVAIWLLWLWPPAGESSPEIHVYWWPKDPCGVKEHVECVKEQTDDSLGTFAIYEGRPPEPNDGSSKTKGLQPVTVTIRVACFPSNEQGKNVLEVTVTDDRKKITCNHKWPRIWKEQWPQPWHERNASVIQATTLYSSTGDPEDIEQVVRSQAETLAGDIRDRIWRAYPTYGRIVGRRGSEVSLNIGRNHGVRTEYLFDVVPASGRTERIGRIQVLTLNYEDSSARILPDSDTERIVKRCRVINMTEPNSPQSGEPVVSGSM